MAVVMASVLAFIFYAVMSVYLFWISRELRKEYGVFRNLMHVHPIIFKYLKFGCPVLCFWFVVIGLFHFTNMLRSFSEL